ncbi:hypothetical protein Golax_013884 [Gossypium laxum]|uniref:Uncharacterized protein n=1 Tax=Gossypium laxum TaxID=34288 RepID=A0A7J8ZT18_9ROSI|nr:hypothetical protein [Gossypium laxum]
MAALRSFLRKRCLTYNELMMTRRLVSTEPIIDSPSLLKDSEIFPRIFLILKLRGKFTRIGSSCFS